MKWLREGMPNATIQPQWERLTDRFRSLRWDFCLSTALIQFSPQVSMQCLEPSDVGLPVNGQSGTLPLYLKPPGSRQQGLLHGVIYIPAWLDFAPLSMASPPPWWEHSSSKKSDESYPPEVILPHHFLFWIQDLLFMFHVTIIESSYWPMKWSVKSKPMARSWAECGDGFGNRHWLRPRDIVCIPAV